MNVDVRAAPAPPAGQSKLAIADCDIHPRLRARHGRSSPGCRSAGRSIWRRSALAPPAAGRRVRPIRRRSRRPAAATPGRPDGGAAGQRSRLHAAQHLDPNNVELGILNPLHRAARACRTSSCRAAICHAINEWQVAALDVARAAAGASVVVPYEDAAASVRGDRAARRATSDFAQVLLLSRTAEPLGQPALLADLRGGGGGRPAGRACTRSAMAASPITGRRLAVATTSRRWSATRQACQAVVTSLVIEGVFERIPEAEAWCMVEGGFAWAAVARLAAGQALEAAARTRCRI